MTTTINASPANGIVQTADGSGVMKLQSNGVTTNALAWVNFDGTPATPTIRASYNIGSVTKVNTGNYTVNFTTALSDANYTPVSSPTVIGTAAQQIAFYGIDPTSTTTSAIASRLLDNDGNTFVAYDSSTIYAAYFGN